MSISDPYDTVLFDLDGVLYRADTVIPGAPEAVARMRAAGKRVAFLTNNSSRTPEQVAAKLRAMGIEARKADVETSALATAQLLDCRGVQTAFVVGEDGVQEALADAGIRLLDGAAERADVVVVGWDRRITYEKLARAALLVERGAALVATNADASYPAPEGRLPGAGALLAAITTATGATPEVVGKPHPSLLYAALSRVGGNRPLLVGDRLDTDVAAAVAAGWDSVLVLTGISTRTDVASSAVKPTFVAEDLSSL